MANRPMYNRLYQQAELNKVVSNSPASVHPHHSIPTFVTAEDDTPSPRESSPPPGTSLIGTKPVSDDPQTQMVGMREDVSVIYGMKREDPPSPPPSEYMDKSDVLLDVSEVEQAIKKPEHKLTDGRAHV